jgi:PAS domain S-box-containing protein
LAAAILERVQDGIFVVDGANHIAVWTASAARFFQVAADQAVGRHFGEVLPFAMAGSSERQLLTAIRAGQSWRGEGSVRRADGSEL